MRPPQEIPNEHSSLVDLTLRAMRVAKTAVAAAADGLAHRSPAQFVLVSECEKELDHLDQEIDERVTQAVTSAPAGHARELLACLKCITDLERIGDLLSGFMARAEAVGNRLSMEDVNDLIRMATLLEQMLGGVYEAFSRRDLDRAITVLRADSEVDRLRNLVHIRHVEGAAGPEGVQVLFMAQALERAGDHAKNLAEEICHLVSGHTVRHVLRSNAKSDEQMYLEWLRGNQNIGR